MASRTLFRRLSQVNRRTLLRGCTGIRPLITSPHIQPVYASSVQSCKSVRCLSTKPGDGMIINIQDKEDFQKRVIDSSVPVVVDFHADWCGPCKLLGPRLEAIIGSKEGKVILAKIDVDEQDELAMDFMINSIPTVMGFKNKEMKSKFIGLKDDAALEEFVDRLME